MADIKWIKVAVDMFEDSKIDFVRSLPEGDAIIVIWIQMLAIAGKSNADGYLMVTEGIPYTEQLLSDKLRRPPVVLRFALDTLLKLRMINVEDGPYHITKWDKHQNIEGMEKVRSKGAIRQKEYRDRLKGKNQLLLGSVTRDVTSDVTDDNEITSRNATELELDLEINNIYPEIQDDVKIIFDHWNTKKIMKHRELTNVMRSKVNARLESRTADEIITAIDNYHAIISDPETYWYSHRFTIQEFMNPKNIDRFLSDNNPFDNHRRTEPTFKQERHHLTIVKKEPTPEELREIEELGRRAAPNNQKRAINE